MILLGIVVGDSVKLAQRLAAKALTLKMQQASSMLVQHSMTY